MIIQRKQSGINMKKETNGGKGDKIKIRIRCRTNGQTRSEPESVRPQGEQKVIPFFLLHIEKRLRV